ncbi:MAG: hypothetical protein IPN49_16635 [Saprospiraceae bacterium]|nr:hypothetical protein [Saprospiraceae bacterium]
MKSQNGKFILTLETSGIQTWSVDHSRFVWQVSGAPDFTKTFSLNNHGVLVIISNTDRSLWNSGTQNRGAQTLSLNNNGNLELLGGTSGTEVLWTGTANLNHQ